MRYVISVLSLVVLSSAMTAQAVPPPPRPLPPVRPVPAPVPGFRVPIRLKPEFRHLRASRWEVAPTDKVAIAEILIGAVGVSTDTLDTLPPQQRKLFDMIDQEARKGENLNADVINQNWNMLIRGTLTSDGVVDIDMLVQLVLKAVAAETTADLRAQLETMRNNNEAKKELRKHLEEMKKLRAERNLNLDLARDLDAKIADAKSQLDSLSEMGEMESLRLQMAMDRMSKLMSTLSNLLKKMSDTQSSIIQNIR